MIYISNKGNIFEKNIGVENTPKYVNNTLMRGFEVIVDIHIVSDVIMMHETPITIEWLNERKSKLWLRVESLQCISKLHSFRIILNKLPAISTNATCWSHILLDNIYNQVFVSETFKGTIPKGEFYGICSDEIGHFKISSIQPPLKSRPGKIKLIISDLDGVLVDSKHIHYDAFNLALAQINEKFIITHEEHLSIYDGLSTRQKLKLLVSKKNFPVDKCDTTWRTKQMFTRQLFKTNISSQPCIIDTFKKLRQQGFIICVASNCIRQSVIDLLQGIGIIDLVFNIFSNEDVQYPKPNPEIYKKAMKHFKMTTDQTLVMEDSAHGKQSAILSGAHLMPIHSPKDVNIENIMEYVNNIETSPAPVQILIPIAGKGIEYGVGLKKNVDVPWPLVIFKGKTLLEHVVSELKPPSDIPFKFIFIVQRKHSVDFDLSTLLTSITNYAPICIIETDEPEIGALDNILRSDFDITSAPLIISNASQLIGDNRKLYGCLDKNCTVLTHIPQNHRDTWSYITKNKLGEVLDIQEGNKISNEGTTGIFIWNNGRGFVEAATNAVLKKELQHNGKFYVSAVVKEMLIQDQTVSTERINLIPIRTQHDINAIL